jgi:hypothetical protein
VRFHGRYTKYHRNEVLVIVRGICQTCGVTHALIPSFSLPDSSHDAGDVEQYLAGRAARLSRRQAGAHFLAALRDMRVLKRIEMSFARSIRNWSAIFAMDIPTKCAYATLAAVVVVSSVAVLAAATVSTADLPAGVLCAANLYALERGVNMVFASRSSILVFPATKAGRGKPHNLASARNVIMEPDSS